MHFEKVFIPYGAYWSTPFCRWQGNFSHLHAVKFAAETTLRALADRKISPETFDGIVLGMTIPQQYSFYGAPWLAGLIGAPNITGPIIAQACATSARSIISAALEIENQTHEAVLVITCDRTSNSPHIYYPNPLGTGGIGEKEDWVWDNFGYDPYAKNSMIQTAENVAREVGIKREQQDEVTLMRYQQYQDALKDDKAFHRRFMIVPVEVKDPSGRKKLATVTGDEGIYPTTAEGLARLRPVLEGGTITFGTQTFPADGNCGVVITTRQKAENLSRQRGVLVQLVSYGQARAKKGFMAMSIVPAARQALARADVSVRDLKAIKTHNPFAVNDIYFAREMGVKLESMNNYGCPLIWGHPQGPTGSRALIELIEELVQLGGGYGLFDGCAAGDTAVALVIKVTVE
jgi:acetyl-CoA acetyltransferase family protein